MTQLHFDATSHAYYVDGELIPSVTQIIRPLEAYYRLDQTMLRPYAERGTAVHQLTEIYDLTGEPDPLMNPDLAGYLLAWLDFRKDFGFTPIATEHRFYHEELLYCGTIDRVGVLRGNLAILDIKTSTKLGPAIGVQLSGYQHGYDPEGKEGVTHRYAVQLAGDGTYRVQEYKDNLDWPVFVGMRALHSWTEKYKRTVTIGDVRPRTDPEQLSNWPTFVGEATSNV